MTADQERAAEIAGKLSKAQREAVGHIDNRLEFWTNDERVGMAVERKGLAGPYKHGGMRDWTPLGLAVRAHLKGQTDG